MGSLRKGARDRIARFVELPCKDFAASETESAMIPRFGTMGESGESFQLVFGQNPLIKSEPLGALVNSAGA
jgi:hypothetical protein